MKSYLKVLSYILNISKDTVAEWLRRSPAKRMSYALAGSNPVGVDYGSVPEWLRGVT